MKPNSLVTRFSFAALAIMLLSPAVAAAQDSKLNATAVVVPVANASFEDPNDLIVNTWTTNDVPGWQVLAGSWAGVWRPGAAYFPPAQVDGSNILYINYGGVTQTLPITLQPMTDYSFSVRWGYPFSVGWGDMTGDGFAGVALQFVAGKRVLATCAPQSTQPQGEFSTVTLVYHSDDSGHSIGEPLSIRILVLPVSGNGEYSANRWWQLDVDDAKVSFTDLRGTPNRSFTRTEECSIDYSTQEDHAD